jgi:transcriptional regulator with XRE-family HTH domain
MNEFGALMAAYRSRLGVSQYRLALQSNIHRTFICRLENGQRNPSRKMTEKLVAALSLNTREANIFRTTAGYAPVHTRGVT